MATSNNSVISAADKFLILLQIGVLIALGFFYNEYKAYKESILSLTEQYMVYVKEVEDIKSKMDNFKQQLSIFDKNIKEKCDAVNGIKPLGNILQLPNKQDKKDVKNK